MNNMDLSNRVSVLESEVKMLSVHYNNQSKKIEKLDETANLIHKMNVLLEVQTTMSKNQQKQIEQFTDVVHSINVNLTNLNHNQEKLNDKFNYMDKRVTKAHSKIDSLQTTHEDYVDEVRNNRIVEAERNGITFTEIGNKLLTSLLYVIPSTIVSGAIMYYVMKFIAE